MTTTLDTSSFGATSTADEVLSGINLKGKRILVTGVSAGLGAETARALAAHGAHVVGAARDLNKAKTATAQVRKDAAANGGKHKVVELDLANLKSVRACSDQLLAKGELFDMIIANAGAVLPPHSVTRRTVLKRSSGRIIWDTLSWSMVVTVFTMEAKLVNLSSAGHRYSNVDLEDPNFEHTPYEPFVAMVDKTANILFAVAFDKRHRGRGVRCSGSSRRHKNGIRTLRGSGTDGESNQRDQSAACSAG